MRIIGAGREAKERDKQAREGGRMSKEGLESLETQETQGGLS